nr:MAG: hypothetical protein [Bacteriophage sp.]
MNMPVVTVVSAIAVAVARLLRVRTHKLDNPFGYQRYAIRRIAAVVLVGNLENDLCAEARLIRRKNRNFDLVAHGK